MRRTLGVPVGIATNLVVDGEAVVVPMAVEEPSVIAAVSGAAKTLCGNGRSIATEVPERNLVEAQIRIRGISTDRLDEARKVLESSADEIKEAASLGCVGMTRRGGGVTFVRIRLLDSLVVQITIDVCEAMGANTASSVADAAAELIELKLRRMGNVETVRIVSNHHPMNVVKAHFSIPIAELAYKSYEGKAVAANILDTYQWATTDVYRAVTHNKGIMNGVDAAALATGQDWRAIEAAAHAFAAENGGYKPLSRYWIEEDGVLCGSLSMPIIVGTRGGVTSSAAQYRDTLCILRNPNSRRLKSILIAVGLCQNFAAMRALSTEGIQRGHMALHVRNMALAEGMDAQQAECCANRLRLEHKITAESVRKAIKRDSK